MEFTRIEDLNQYRLYKVCQITIDGKPLMYFVKDEHRIYHANILKEVLTLNGLTHTVVRKLGDEGLVFHGDGFVINGMGGAKVLTKKCILLFGNSIDFDMSISSAHIERFRKENPEWRFKIPPSPGESLAS